MANGLVTANQFRLTPDIAGGVSRGLQLGGQIQQFQQGLQQAELQPQIQQLRQQALGGNQQALTQLAGIAPGQAEEVQKFQLGQVTSEQDAQQRRVKSVVEGALRLQNLPDDASRLNAAKARRQQLIEQQKIDPNISTVDTDEIIGLFESGQADQANALIGSAVQTGRDLGLFEGASTRSAGTREFQTLVEIAKGDPKGETVEGRAAGVKLGLIAKASTSAAERIATDPVLTSAVAASGAEIAGAKETATKEAELTQQLKFKPQISTAVKLAEKEATERGEVLTDLKRSEAALPGLLNAVSQLRDLSVIATSTFGGRLFDTAVKETGFGSTKGATARAKFIAIVNNQVLPLLKPTFGAAFTVSEGDALRATLGDPNASPTEKMATLDAFIDQKRRDIETKQTQLGATTQPTPAQTPATPATDVDLSTLSLEELIALRDRG